MEPVVGIFPSRASAEAGAKRLFSQGFAEEHVAVLLPGEPATPEELEDEVPTEDAEQSGVGPAVGGVVGAAAGATAGFGAGVVAASLLVPGVGAVTAIGLAAAALFGAAGAVGGAHAGEVLEETRRGIPKDELYLYEDALAHGYGIVFATPESEEQEKKARRILLDAGAKSLEAAREAWWVGIRDVEKAHYDAEHGDFESAEDIYRQGLLGAMQPDLRGRTFEQALPALRRRFDDAVDHPAFRRGYARGAERARQREDALASSGAKT
ncbi:MAG TPA: hypothetical protein VKG23_16575 [Thermoanaerobaculia bacterium]|nr:hypothetical protein [Thermoanaerobaculia bacterium]